MTAATPLRVCVVEDDAPIREAYAALLSADEGLSLAGAYGSCEAALAALDDACPDVVLMDVGLPGMDGIAGTRALKALRPTLDVLMLTVYDDDEKVFLSILAGASGYLLKSTPPHELTRAVREIRFGAPMTAPIARRVLDLVRARAAPPQAPKETFRLSPRELDILEGLVAGKSIKAIGEHLYLSPLTVHSHIKRIYEKLQVHSKAEAVAKVLRHGLLT